DLLIVMLKGKQTFLDLGQRREIIGDKDLALDDREVNLDLIQRTGMQWGVHQHHRRPLGAESVGGLLAAVSRTVVHNPEDATGRAIDRAVGPSPRRPSDPRARFRFWSRSGQIAWLGGHPRPRDRSRHRRGGIHARPASGEQEKEPARSAYGNELGCWFSRRRRERTRRPARAYRSSVSRTGRECDLLFRRTAGRGERSNCDVAKGGGRRR